MTHFVRLTSRNDGNPVMINLDNVATIFATKSGSRISFPGSDEDYFDVKETLDEIEAIEKITEK